MDTWEDTSFALIIPQSLCFQLFRAVSIIVMKQMVSYNLKKAWALKRSPSKIKRTVVLWEGRNAKIGWGLQNLRCENIYNLFLFLCLFSSVEGKLKEHGGRNSAAECWERDHGLSWGGEKLRKMMRFPMEVRASLYSMGQDNMAGGQQAGSPNTERGSRMGDQVQTVNE